MIQIVIFLSFSLLLTVSAKSQNIQGTVFEDKNYGGGSGRNLSASSGNVRPGATVELYDNAGNFLQSTTTNVSGIYTFGGLAGTYKVRVVNGSVSSARAGYVSSLLAVQTFSTEALVAGIAVPVMDRVGGEIPAEQDAPANTTSLTLNSLNSVAGQKVQSIASVAVTSFRGTTGIDFGFCFDVIVNVNDAGQGSYRQFLTNAVNLGDEIKLVQSGNTWNSISTVNALQPLPSGKESSIFMISDGATHPGLRAGLSNLLSVNGVAVITVSTALYPVLGYSTAANPDNTSIDGGTQTANVGNTNNIILGTGGIAGIGPDAIPNSGDESVLSQINGAEVEIDGNTSQYPLQVFANNVSIRCISIHGNAADIHLLGGNNFLIEQCIIGATATSFTPPAIKGGNSRALIYFDLSAVSATVQNNLIGFSTQEEIRLRFWDATNINYTISNNEIAGGISGTPGAGPGISMNDNYTPSPNNASAKGSVLIKGNLIRDCGPTGINSGVHYNFANANQFLTTVEENTLIRNSAGFQALFGSGNDFIIHNLIKDNRNMGVRLGNRSTDPAVVTAGVKISQNSIYNNGTAGGAPSGLGIDLNEDNVTANSGAYNFTIPNIGINYPIINTITLAGGTLTVNGFVGSAASQSAFGNAKIEFFKANSTDNNQAGEKIVGDLLSVQHGEGEIFLGSGFSDANGNFSISFSTAVFHPGDALTATSTDGNNNTSEFSPDVLMAAGAVLPVAIINFQVVKENDAQVKLKWQVGIEINVKEYVIEHSLNGAQFIEKGKVTASGLNNYQFLSNSLVAGINYYRLKTIDISGQISYSEIRRLNVTKESTINVFPSPATTVINITASTALINKPAIISIVDMNGRVVLQKIISSISQTQSVGVSKLTNGKYNIAISIDGEVISKPIVIIK